MIGPIRLAWRQLDARRPRLVMAIAGVAFAVVLMLMQLGFEGALLSSSVRYHERLRGDVVLIHPQSRYLVMMRSFPRRRLDQARGVAGVESVIAVRTGFPFWDAGDDAAARNIFLFAFDPETPALELEGLELRLHLLKRDDQLLFDRRSRPEYGPIAERIAGGEKVACELNERRFDVVGTFALGTSFGVDGSMIASTAAFERAFPGRPRGVIELGLLRATPGTDPVALRAELERRLPADVTPLTRAEFVKRETDYWSTVTPVGYVFSFAVFLGFGVGAVIVAQILFADVTDHIQEYATLKAIGHEDAFLSRVVIAQAVLLALLGYLPGLGVSLALYRVAARGTGLPMVLTPATAAAVLGLTVVMCAGAGALALRRVREADPADVFG